MSYDKYKNNPSILIFLFADVNINDITAYPKCELYYFMLLKPY